MPAYHKTEAREWARAHMRGLDCVTIPTFSQDLKRIAKAGIQHDIGKAIEFGFDGTLLVADIAFSIDEYVQFAAWAREAAGSRLRLVHHAAFNTLEENIEAAQRVAPYCDYALLCYPANFYPTSEQQVYDYTRAFCEVTDLGVMLFPVPLWNFGRLHQAQMLPALLRRLIINAESLNASGVTDVRQLTQIAPGFVGSRQNAAFLPTIRGVGSAGVSRNDESNVALYIDGVYQPDAATNITELVAIDRVEVLRGPQGTIFGRNATGGLVNIITPLPSFDVHGKATLSFGSFGHAVEAGLRSYFTGPITNNIAVDLGVVVRHNSGYIRDLVRGGYLGEATLGDFRSKQLFQLTDAFRVVTTIAYTDFDDNSGNTFQPYRNLTRARSVPGTVLPTKPYQAAVDILPVSRFKRWNASLQASLDLGSVRLETTTGYNDSDITQAADTDASPILFGGNYSYPKSWALSQEVRALSAGNGPFQWIAGAYFFEQRGRVYVINPSATTTTILNSSARTKAYAGFAEGNYTIADALRITVGARYNSEDRSFTNTNNGVLRVNNATTSADRWTYRGSLQYSFDANSSVYVTYSTGFKSGVFNTLSSNPTPTRPETIKSIEGGLKLQPAPWLRANLAVFHYDYNDLQVQARDPNSGTFILQNAANAKIKGGELELTARASRTLRLRASGTLLDAKYGSFPAAQVFIPQANGANLASVANVSGNDLVRSPKYTLQFGGDWNIALGDGEFSTSFNLLRSARVYYDFANLASQAPYTTMSGQIGWGPNKAPWRVTLAVTNLTDARVAQQITAGPFGTYMSYERPRRILGSFEVKF